MCFMWVNMSCITSARLFFFIKWTAYSSSSLIDHDNYLLCNECQGWTCNIQHIDMFKRSKMMAFWHYRFVWPLVTLTIRPAHKTLARVMWRAMMASIICPFIWLLNLMIGQVLMMMETRGGSDQRAISKV